MNDPRATMVETLTEEVLELEHKLDWERSYTRDAKRELARVQESLRRVEQRSTCYRNLLSAFLGGGDD